MSRINLNPMEVRPMKSQFWCQDRKIHQDISNDPKELVLGLESFLGQDEVSPEEVCCSVLVRRSNKIDGIAGFSQAWRLCYQLQTIPEDWPDYLYFPATVVDSQYRIAAIPYLHRHGGNWKDTVELWQVNVPLMHNSGLVRIIS